MIIARKIFRAVLAVVLTLITLTFNSQRSELNNSYHSINAGIGITLPNSAILPISSIQGGLPDTANKAFENYIDLKKFYLEWNNGLPGSGNYHKRKIREFLISIIGKEILTEYNFTLETTGVPSEMRLVCGFSLDKWLQIKGKINTETIKNISNYAASRVEKSWALKKLLSVKGRIKNFKLGSGSRCTLITLYLDDIQLEKFDNIKINNKK